MSTPPLLIILFRTSQTLARFLDAVEECFDFFTEVGEQGVVWVLGRDEVGEVWRILVFDEGIEF